MGLHELRQRRHEKARECRSILNKAEAESRDLKPEERSRFDAIDAEILDLDRRIRGAEIGADDDGQRSGRGHEFAGSLSPAGGAATEGRADFLLGERRFAEWQAERGGGRGEFQAEEGRAFSLGRLVQRMAGRSIGGDGIEQRAQAAGADATGGVLVPESLASFVIDRIRPATAVLQAGAQVVPMDSDELSIPRIASGVQGGWRAENAAVAVADMAFERVKLTAKTLAVIVKLPMEMWEDVRPEGAQAIENELIQALATELDRVALRGSGAAPEPRGVRNQAGVEVQSLGANGAAPTNFDPLVRAVGGVMRDNFLPNAAIYSPRTWETLGLLKDTTGQPLQRPTLPEGFRELVSAQVPDNIVQGTSNDTSEVYVGAWGNLMVGVRPTIGVRIKALDQTFAGNMQVGLLAWLRADIGLAHPEAFSVVTGVRGAGKVRVRVREHRAVYVDDALYRAGAEVSVPADEADALIAQAIAEKPSDPLDDADVEAAEEARAVAESEQQRNDVERRMARSRSQVSERLAQQDADEQARRDNAFARHLAAAQRRTASAAPGLRSDDAEFVE